MAPPFSLGREAGHSLAWDITVSDTYADAHVVNTATCRSGSSSQPCSDQQEHQVQPSNIHNMFVPVAIETGGTWHHQAVELVRKIGRRTANITGDARESTVLFQQLSVVLQRGMRSHFKTRSPPASSLQSVVSFS